MAAENTLRFNFLVGRNEVPAAAQKNERALTGLASKTSGFGRIAAVALGGVAVAAGGLAVAGVAMGVKTASSLEQAQIGFTTLLGSASKAQSFLADMVQFANKTPFELQGLIDSSRMLLGYGFTVNQTKSILQDFGDATAAVGLTQDQFQRIMVQVGQSAASGRFQLQDLNAMANNGLPIWPLLSRAMGKSIPALRDMIKHGDLLSKDVLPRLQAEMHKEYGGAMAKQSATLAGLWSTLMDTLNNGMAQVLMPLMPALRSVASNGIAFLGAAFAKLPAVISTVGGFLSRMMPTLQTAVGWLRDTGTRLWQGLQPALVAFGAWVVNDFAPALRDLGGRVFPALQGMVRSVGAAFRDHQDVIAAAGQLFRGVGFAITRILLPALGGVVQVVSAVVGPAVRVLLSVLGAVATAIGKLPDLIGKVTEFGGRVIGGLVAALRTNPIAKAIGDIMSAISTPFLHAFDLLVGPGKEIVSGLASGVGSRAASTAVGSLKAGIAAVILAITTPFTNAQKMLEGVGADIVTGLATGMGEARPKVKAEANATRATIDIALRAPGSGVPLVAGAAVGTMYARGLTQGFIVALDVIHEFLAQQTSLLGNLGPHGFAEGAAFTAQFAAGLRKPVREVIASTEAIVGAVMSPFTQPQGFLLGKGSQIVLGLAAGIRSRYGTTLGVVSGLISGAIRAPFAAAGSWLVGPGSNTVTGLNRGIRLSLPTLAGLVVGSVINVAIKRPFVGTIGWLDDAGRGLVAGFTRGVRLQWGSLSTSIALTIARVRNPFGATGTWLIGAGVNVLTGFMIGMRRAWGSVTSWVSGIASWIRNHKGPISLDARLLIPAGQAIMGGFLRGLKSGAGPAWDFVKSVGGKTVDALRSIYAPIANLGNITVPKNVTGNLAIGRSILSQMGFSDSQWPALYSLWQGESGWNQYARNASSGAYGIPQSLPASKMAAAGADWQTNPATQIEWGLSYIRAAYGTPSNAYAKWLSRSPHWYAAGTPSAARGWAWVGEQGPELVRFRGGEQVVSHRRSAAMAGGVAVYLTIDGSAAGLEDRVVTAVRNATRHGRLSRAVLP